MMILRRGSGVASMLLIAACSNQPSGQDVVRGNGFEITTAELDQAVAASGRVPEGQLAERRQQILQSLIDQKLLASRAAEAKLDQQPAVMRDIEAARRLVLARAWLGSHPPKVAPPGEAEIRKFYDDNAALYAGRTIATVEEIILSGTDADIDKYKAIFKSSNGSLGELAAALRADGHAVVPVLQTRAPENFEIATARRFAALKPGDTVVYNLDGGVNFALVKAVASDPVDFKSAHDVIARVLADRLRIEQINRDLQQLRSDAGIVYVNAKLAPK